MLINRELSNNLSRLFFVVSLVVTGLWFSSCSSPTETDDNSPDASITDPRVLAALIQLQGIPEVPFPPDPAIDPPNEGYQGTVSLIDRIAFTRDGFVLGIQMIIDGDTQVQSSSDTLIIVGKTHEGAVDINLQIIEGDTLLFFMEYSETNSSENHTMEGWMINDNSTGFFQYDSGSHCFWEQLTNFFKMNASDLFYRYSLTDSLNGGGWLSVSEFNVHQEIFRAHWDTLGHGLYWGIWGSGGW